MGKIIFFLGCSLLLARVATADTCLEGNCQDGYGTFQWNDGSQFTGNFVEGTPYGTGTYIDPNGKQFTVTYEDGKPVPPKSGRRNRAKKVERRN
jgi:hypothetical protein